MKRTMFHVFLVLSLTAYLSACGSAGSTKNIPTFIQGGDCNVDNGGCDLAAICTDVTGINPGANCACPDGYIGDGLTCTVDPGNPPLDAGTSSDDGNPVDASTDVPVGTDNGTPTDTNVCVPQCEGKQCGPNGCGGTCGICGPGKTCTVDGVCEIDIQGTVPYGGECSMSADCAAKEPENWDDQAANQTFFQCLDKQCIQGTCSLPFGTPVCLKSCTLSAADDQSNNVSGAPEPDGVEDGNVLCAGADPNGPFGSNYRCIRLTDPQVSQNDFSQCTPGTDFKKCNTNEDCPPDESCQIQSVLGVTDSHCMGTFQGGVGVSQFCENNPHNPSVYYHDEVAHCSDTLCFGIGIGCSAMCGKPNTDPLAGPGSTIADHSICLTSGATCDGGICSTNDAVSCTEDVDCSAWHCDAGFSITSGPPPLLKDTCFPKECGLDKDCVDNNFFCRTFYNGEDTPDTAGWEHMCLRKATNPSAVGEACDENPNDQIPGPVCSNPIWCMSGQCSTHCNEDGHCGAEQACGTIEIPIDLDDNDSYNAQDAFLPLGICLNMKHTGDLTECTTDTDCTVPGEACSSNTFPKGDGTYEVKYYCLAGASATATGGHGDPCGGDSGASCINGTCITFNLTDGSTQGACLATCRSANDCPTGGFLGGGNYKGLCRNIRSGWNGTADIRDDLYIPSCLPLSAQNENGDPTNSLADCSGGAQWVGNPAACGAGEACLAVGISVNPGELSITEFLCLSNLDQNGQAPPKVAGESCDPASETDECASLFCEPLAVGGICSKMCDPAVGGSCSDVPNTSCTRLVMVPRLEQVNEAAVYTCRPTDGSCIACGAQSDCTEGYVCGNVGTGLNAKYRCVKSCAVDGVCDNGTCGSMVDLFGQSIDGCSTTCQ